MRNELNSLGELDPNELFFIPLGIGNAFTRRFFNSSILLVCGGSTVLVDAPAPLRRILAEAERQSGYALDLNLVDNLFLTHLHADHCNGIEEFGFWRMFFASDLPRPRLAVQEDQLDVLWQQRLRAGMGAMGGEVESRQMKLDDYFEIMPYQEGDELTFGINGFVLEPRIVKHLIPTCGFKATYKGRKLGYSSDTAFDPGLIDFFSDCDHIIHETGPVPGHTPLEDLVRLPSALRDRISLIHIPDDFDIRRSPLAVLEEGRLYRV